jgi:crotonobetainyl-CoA:carnitine CoA-transferase CaiB-like acyl-CoA transferase
MESEMTTSSSYVVVEIGSSVASAQASLFLQRMGARVLKINSHELEDLPWERLEELRDCLSFGKDSLDVATIDKNLIDELISIADLIIDDHLPSFWLQRGINLRSQYTTQGNNAHWCSITPYGIYGSHADVPSSELTSQASGPFMIRIGEKGKIPLPMKGPQAYISAAWHAALASSAYLFHSKVNNLKSGVLIDISIQESLYMHSELGASNWHFNQVELTQTLNATSTAQSSGFQTADGKSVNMLFHDREWPRVARMIGREDLERDERFMARFNRAQNMDALEALLVPWFFSRTAMEIVELGQESGMPISTTRLPDEVLVDPQLDARNAFEEISIGSKTVKYPVGVGRFSGHESIPIQRTHSGTKYSDVVTYILDNNLTVNKNPVTLDNLQFDITKPLKGIRVLDLTNTWAAPKGATLLGDLGAEIIKIEGIAWMDMLRGWTAPPESSSSYPGNYPGDKPWDRYIMWLGLARNKLSAGIELTTEEGMAIMVDLVKKSDIVLTNMSFDTRKKYDLNIQALQEINPQIIFATLSGYGETGPRSSWRLFGDGQAAFAGLFVGTGYKNEGSIPLGAYGDPVNGTATAFHVVQGLLMNQLSDEKTSMHVDISCVETCITYAQEILVESQLNELEFQGSGVDCMNKDDFYPYNIYETSEKDGWISITCMNDEQRSRLLDGIAILKSGMEIANYSGTLTSVQPVALDQDMISDPNKIEKELVAICKSIEPRVIEKVFQSKGVPCQRILRGRDFDSEGSLSSRHFISWQFREDLGTYPVYSAPWTVNGDRPTIEQQPARFGEHNDYVFHEILGIDHETINSYKKDGIVGDAPMTGAELGFRPNK